MSLNRRDRSESLACGIPHGLLNPDWFHRQSRDELYQLARDQVGWADLESTALTDLGQALGDLQRGHDAACEGVGILLTQFSAVTEVRLHLIHSALTELQSRDRKARAQG